MLLIVGLRKLLHAKKLREQIIVLRRQLGHPGAAGTRQSRRAQCGVQVLCDQWRHRMQEMQAAAQGGTQQEGALLRSDPTRRVSF